MHLGLLEWIVFTYTSEGETILDPMLGSGTLLYATLMGRSVVGVELESKFVTMAEDNLKKLNQMPLYLGVKQRGQAQIIHGDARQLEGLLVDKCIFSPPYAEQKGEYHNETFIAKITEDLVRKYKTGEIKGHGGSKEAFERAWSKRSGLAPDNPSNISNLPYGQIDKIITSPPYEEAMGKKHHSPRADKLAKEKSNPVTYTDRIDCVLTSPPYEAAVTGKDGIDWSKGTRGKAEGNKPRDRSKEPAFNHLSIGGAGFKYGDGKDNIGNLKSDNYLQAMLQVYQQCHSVLRDGGLMILVVKNFLREQKEVDLRADTVKLCEQAGFSYVEEHHRILPSQSFWRVIYAQRFPNAPKIDKEYVLVFRS